MHNGIIVAYGISNAGVHGSIEDRTQRIHERRYVRDTHRHTHTHTRGTAISQMGTEFYSHANVTYIKNNVWVVMKYIKRKILLDLQCHDGSGVFCAVVGN